MMMPPISKPFAMKKKGRQRILKLISKFVTNTNVKLFPVYLIAGMMMLWITVESIIL